jgi:hypothetical protein
MSPEKQTTETVMINWVVGMGISLRFRQTQVPYLCLETVVASARPGRFGFQEIAGRFGVHAIAGRFCVLQIAGEGWDEMDRT